MAFYPKRKGGKKPYRKRAYKYAKRTLGKPAAKAIKAIVKTQLNKVIETKINDYYMTPVGNLTSIYHNTWFQCESDPFFLYQGTADDETSGPTNRVGDSVFIKSVHMQLNLASSPSFSTMQYRLVVLKIKAGATMPSDITAHPQCPNRLMAPIDREQQALMSVAYDRKGWFINNGQTANGGHDGARKLLSINIPINKKVKYDGNTGNNNSFRLIPYILVFGRLGDSGFNCNIEYFRRTYFQDA